MVGGGTLDIASRADDLIARGFASRKAQRARIAHRDAGGEAFGGSLGRNTEQRIADHFSPVREALPLIDRLGRPRNHLCPRMCGRRRPFVATCALGQLPSAIGQDCLRRRAYTSAPPSPARSNLIAAQPRVKLWASFGIRNVGNTSTERRR